MLCALVAAASVLHFGQEPVLQDRWKLVTEVDHWQEAQLTVGLYLWWSPSKILIALPDDKQELFDTARKAALPFSAPAAVEGQWAVSPDRSKVITQDWKGQQITWRITDPTGRKLFGSWSIHSRTSPPQLDQDRGYGPPEVQWSEDGSRIYQIEYWPTGRSEILVSDSDKPHGKPVRGWTYSRMASQVTERDPAHPERSLAFPVTSVATWHASIVVHAGKALLVPYDFDNRRFPLREWELKHPAAVRRWTVKAPTGMRILEYRPSPNYKKAAWVMGRPGANLGGYADESGYPYRAISLWTSGLHGEGLREIGQIPFGTNNADKQMDHYQHFGGLLWNPDCKRVSFICYRKLYTVDVSR
jgi:hypothetical protein